MNTRENIDSRPEIADFAGLWMDFGKV